LILSELTLRRDFVSQLVPMQKLLIRHKAKAFKFLNWEFQDHIDGSLYIVFDRLGKGPRTTWSTRDANIPSPFEPEGPNEKFRISYHPCGHVRYHGFGPKPKSIHCEPIYAITKKQGLALLSIPNIDSLTLAERAQDNDFVYDWPEQAQDRVTVWIELGPSTLESPFERGNIPLATVRYGQWFTIFVSLGPLPVPIPDEINEQAVVRVVPDRDFVEKRVSKEEALVAFHQAKHGVTHQPVTEFNPNSGVYRIICAVPMRIPPRLTIEFFDSLLTAEVERCTISEVRFKVKGPGGYKKGWVPIKSVALDAEF
jgi:hypothetical protein